MSEMSPEALFELVEPQRADGRFDTRWVHRCPDRCHQIGVYVANGQAVTIISDLKLRPKKAEELGLPQMVQGRAWMGDRAPAGEIFGCRHELKWTKP